MPRTETAKSYAALAFDASISKPSKINVSSTEVSQPIAYSKDTVKLLGLMKSPSRRKFTTGLDKSEFGGGGGEERERERELSLIHI